MYEGSLYGQWEAIITFQQMIVIADDEGFVDITPPALSAKTSIPLEIIQKGIEILESDDPYSRTPGEDGKRIIRISDKRPWGWKIVNYQKYRDMASNEDRKRYMRQYMREYRKQEKFTDKEDVKDCKPKLAQLTHTDTDTYTDKNKYSVDFLEFYNAYPLKKSKAKAFESWKKLKPDLKDCLSAIQSQMIEKAFLKAEKKFCPEWKHPSTWLNQKCWEDEVQTTTKKIIGYPECLYIEAPPGLI